MRRPLLLLILPTLYLVVMAVQPEWVEAVFHVASLHDNGVYEGALGVLTMAPAFFAARHQTLEI